MSVKVVLFDLDGTLLPMDQSVFIKTYFGAIAKRLASYGYTQGALIDAIWKGTAAMIRNDGKKSNEAVFWDTFAEIYGDAVRDDEPYFEEFYVEDFDNVKVSCGFDPDAAETVQKIKEMGLRVALATNPIFPSIATEKRIAWAGLSPEDFELYTTYENSRYSKPNLEYYKDIVAKLGVPPEECLMVGNDVGEDMVAEKLGMKVFLMPACLINKAEEDISRYPQGDFSELLRYVEKVK